MGKFVKIFCSVSGNLLCAQRSRLDDETGGNKSDIGINVKVHPRTSHKSPEGA
jgi:hypothetical protein